MNNSIINTAQINRARINMAGLNCVGIPSSSRSDKPTIDPALKAKLVGVWDCRGKTNEDADRGIIRDRTGKGDHLEILNAAYTEGSGYKDGAFVTDGVDDMIMSNKSFIEMIDHSEEFTVISVWKNLSSGINTNFRTNVIRTLDFIQNMSEKTSDVYISGYKYSKRLILINDILGDKLKIVTQQNGSLDIAVKSKLSIQGFINSENNLREVSSIAYYGGFVAKGALTTDEINQIVAYYNLDWWVEPDGWYDVAKQGITNENHATFNDKLIDFSPNKRDFVCNGFAWSGNSGVGKWAVDFKSDSWVKYKEVSLDSNILIWNAGTIVGKFLFSMPEHKNIALPSFTVDVEFDNILYYYYYTDPDKNRSVFICKQGINILPASVALNNPPIKGSIGFYVDGKSTYAKITQIPEQEGGLWHDGVDDGCISIDNFPAYKDFTVAADRTLFPDPITAGCGIAKDATTGAFIIDYNSTHYQSFGGPLYKHLIPNGVRKTSFVSKYASLEVPVMTAGANVDKLTKISIGTFREGNTRFIKYGFYGFLIYPYSMNAFLIERQLKKLKFGTLYPKNE